MIMKQQGSGIVELLVGLFISTLIMLTVYETTAFLEANQRSAVSSNGSLASLISGMNYLDRDIKMAGLGLSATGLGTCAKLNAYYNGTVLADDAVIAPVVIQHNITNPDRISIFYGTAVSGGAPSQLLVSMANTTDPIALSNSSDLIVGQNALLMPSDIKEPCMLIGVTQVQNAGSLTNILHDSITSYYNPATPSTTFKKSITYDTSSVLLNLGNVHWVTWRVNNDHLETINQVTGAVSQLAGNIVFMRAQYGVTDGVNDDITQWVDASGAWANLDSTLIRRIRAVKFALVSRNPKRIKPSIPGSACDATTTAPAPWPGGTAIDLSANKDWKCYRYRVMKTIMPLKNFVWSIG